MLQPASRSSHPRFALLLAASTLGLLATTGCPAQVEYTDPAKGEQGPQTSPDDPRVVQVGDDLYAKEAPSNPVQTGNPESPGTGYPDETNGECRLFAPKLPDPQCCPFESGFDVDVALEACGLDAYLGESMRSSCVYFFMKEGEEKPVSFRATHTLLDDAKAAAEAEVKRLNFQMRRKDLKAEPVPGVPGAYMVKDRVLRWAFIPGWPKARQFAWMEKSCPDAKIPDLIRVMAEAEPPLKDAKRPMLPTARRPGAPAPSPTAEPDEVAG